MSSSQPPSATTGDLASKSCEPCTRASLLDNESIVRLLGLVPGWMLKDSKIEKTYRFKTYLDGLNFACNIGRIAEAEDHHPDMMVGWRKVKVSLSTHALGGLTMNDFIMAAKSDREYSKISGEKNK